MQFTATYPKSLPLVTLSGDKDLSDATRYKIRHIIETEPKILVAEGDPMIWQIGEAIRDVLEDAAQAQAVGKEMPSLEEERAVHEAAVAKLMKEQQDEQQKKKDSEVMEEDRLLGNMVEEELKRQKTKYKEAKRKSKPPGLNRELSMDHDGGSADDRLFFDQPITMTDETNYTWLFQGVSGKCRIRRGPVSEVYTVRLITSGSTADTPTLVLKETSLEEVTSDGGNFKRQLQLLETLLEDTKKAQHRHVLEFLDFKIHMSSEGFWSINLLTEYANKGSLEELLDVVVALPVAKARAWTIELLDALRYLHDRGIIHQDLHAGNVMLVRSALGDIRVKLGDCGYQQQLHAISGKNFAASASSSARSAYWLAPEISQASRSQFSQKTDVWDFGIVFLQMLFGLDILQNYVSPNALMEKMALSSSMGEIVQKFFKADSKKRPRAFELSSCEFLATDAPILVAEPSTLTSRKGSLTSMAPTTPGRLRRESMHNGFHSSRYKEDFVEEGRLGVGGFGEVVRARKKLDGNYYAIKKITQKSSSSLTEILKEVRLLSQLNHPYVVRYYNTWTEELADTSGLQEESVISETEASDDNGSHFRSSDGDLAASTGGLDFISSSGYPEIEFGFDSDEHGSDPDDEEFESYGEDDEEDTSTSGQRNKRTNGLGLELKRTRSDSRYGHSTRTILYIQMEYCEKRVR